jgi:hypothetical protein
MAILAQDTDSIIQMLIDTGETLKNELVNQSDRIIMSTAKVQTKHQATMLRGLGNAQDVEMLLLQSLRFPTIDHRHLEIPEAHCKTFNWIFDEPIDRTNEWSSFVQWLKSEKRLYWVSGKAASGKSTLMRYIFDHADTRYHLRTWAQDFELEVAGFFFWNSGTLEQRSQAGLLRSLLYQVLYKCPNLVRGVFPDEWRQESSVLANKGHCSPMSWSLPVLKSTFARWITLAPSSTRLCLSFDGLDEYEGDHEEMCEYLKDISASANFFIKICVSSRPWVVFDETLKGVPRLKLQELTSPDIQLYVRDKFEDHPRMILLSQAEPQHAAELVDEIVSKASGVFLWVTLVVKSLLRGLMNHDRIDILRRRLRDLPSDLNLLYVHIMRHIEPFYKEEAFRTFQMYRIMSYDDLSLADLLESDRYIGDKSIYWKLTIYRMTRYKSVKN